MSNEITYLYIIACLSHKSNAPIKIGISANPELRVSELQTGNPYPLQLKMKVPMPSREEAVKLEFWLHRKFNKRRMIGEWFRPNGIVLKTAFEEYHQKKGIELTKEKVNKSQSYGSKVVQSDFNLLEENRQLKERIKELENYILDK